MARKKTPTLTDGELRLMEIIWDKGEATVNEILDSLPKDNPPAYNTVLTIMRILEKKGYVNHKKEGRAFVYCPVVDREKARRKALNHLVNNFFNNSPGLLMQNIIEDEKLSSRDLERLKKMIEELE